MCVNAIAPGYVETDMNERLLNDEVRFRQISERIPAGRWAKPEDFAGVVVFLASRASQYVCGEVIVVDGVSFSLLVLSLFFLFFLPYLFHISRFSVSWAFTFSSFSFEQYPFFHLIINLPGLLSYFFLKKTRSFWSFILTNTWRCCVRETMQ